MRVVIGVILASVPASSLAAPADPCANLAAYTCDKDRSTNDGTNSFAPRSQEQIDAIVKSVTEREHITATPFAAQLLNKASPDAYLPFHIWQATGLDKQVSTAKCFNADAQATGKSAVCDAAILKATEAMLKNQLFGEPLGIYEAGDLEQFDQILSDPAAVSTYNDYVKAAEGKVTSVDQRARLQSEFDAVVMTYREKIAELPLGDAVKKKMLERLSNTKLRQDSCADLSAFTPNAFYDRAKSEMTFCPAMLLATDSAFSHIGVLAHELGHAFDRCELQAIDTVKQARSDLSVSADTALIDSGHPFKNLVSCLRSSETANAKVCEVETLSCPFTDATAKKACLLKKQAPFKIGSCAEPNSAPAEDQTRELIADWFASEVIPNAVTKVQTKLTKAQWTVGAGNAFSVLCESEDQTAAKKASLNQRVLACDSHPDANVRLNAVLSTAPALREKLGCRVGAQLPRCTMDGLSTQPTAGGNNSSERSRSPEKSRAVR